MTAQLTGTGVRHWTPDPVRQSTEELVLEKPFEIRLPMSEITP
jgi:hypothetical protein